jgi:NAD(P)H-dependent flavin oxidoreductase YrpB (nitropropane dioxygenase family)
MTIQTQENANLDFPRADAFCKKMGLRFPIVQAGMGGTDLRSLAIAVCRGGGMGALGLTWASGEEASTYVRDVRAATDGTFYVNYVLSFPPDTLPIALEAGAPVVAFSWGIPSADQVSLVRSFGARMGIQVSNIEGARRALDAGADYLSVQGTEAGGHVQAAVSWRKRLGAILGEAGDTPVLVAGGLGDGRALRGALEAGASGGVFGTRFIATEESRYQREYKERLVQATGDDTALTVCFDGGWPNALHRVLQNQTFRTWEADGSRPAGLRPGEADVVGMAGDEPLYRYCIFPANEGMPANACANVALYAGLSVDQIQDIPSARELVPRLWQECVGQRL